MMPIVVLSNVQRMVTSEWGELTRFFHLSSQRAVIDLWCSPCFAVGKPMWYGGGIVVLDGLIEIKC